MMSYCAYADCRNKCVPCSSIVFFTLPQDHRRQIWIDNSGNPELKSLKPSTNKQFCEKHFDPKYLRRQFTRTRLRKDAVPYKYNVERCKMKFSPSQEKLGVDGDTRKYSTDLRKCDEDCFNSDSLNKPEEVLYHQSDYQAFPDVSSSQPDEENDQECSDISMLIIENPELDTHEEFSTDVEQIYGSVTEETGGKCLKPFDDQFEPNLEDCGAESEVHIETAVEESREDYDEDKHYVLSLLGYFRRLRPKSKAIAKLKILQYLTELEFENSSIALNT